MRLFVACLLALIAAAGVWLAVGDGAAPSGGRAAQPSANATHVPAAPLAPAGATPRTPERLEIPAPKTADPVAPAGLEDTPRPELPDLSARFAGWPVERMREHLRDLELRLNSELDVAFKQRFDRGLFETHAVDVETTTEADWDALAQRAAPGELGRGQLRFGDPGPDGKRPAQWQFARLPRAEFRELYERVDERDWLRAELAKTPPPDDP